jgi:hypothetical protein
MTSSILLHLAEDCQRLASTIVDPACADKWTMYAHVCRHAAKDRQRMERALEIAEREYNEAALKSDDETRAHMETFLARLRAL